MVGEERVKNHGKRITALPAISKIESSKTPFVVAKNVKNKMDIKGESQKYGFYRFIGSHYKLRPCAMFRVSRKDHNQYLFPIVDSPPQLEVLKSRVHQKERATEAEPPNLYPNVTAQEKHCR